jgi:hypothetical protein
MSEDGNLYSIASCRSQQLNTRCSRQLRAPSPGQMARRRLDHRAEQRKPCDSCGIVAARDIARTATPSPRPAAESRFYANDTLLRQSLHDLTPFGFERILSGA